MTIKRVVDEDGELHDPLCGWVAECSDDDPVCRMDHTRCQCAVIDQVRADDVRRISENATWEKWSEIDGLTPDDAFSLGVERAVQVLRGES